MALFEDEETTSNESCIYPEYSDRLFATIANQYIGKTVTIPGSRKYMSREYKVSYINKVPRSIQQRLANSNGKSWHNMVYLYNSFADELGYRKILQTSKHSERDKLRMYDSKADIGYHGDFDEMVYLSDGMYIHKSDCWF